MLVGLAIGLSCGGGGGDDTATTDTTLSGVAYYSGPLAGATVTAWQLVDGERNASVSTTTGEDGSWSLSLGLAYETIELEARGGSYAEPAGAGVVTLDASQALHGFAMDVAPAEHRTDVTITPWSDVTLALARARLARGDREPSFNEALATAHQLMAEHLGFSPTHTPIAPLSSAAVSVTEPVKHALSLAGLSEMAATIGADAGLTFRDINTADLLEVLAADVGGADALFDGANDTLAVSPSSCELPAGCSGRGDGCRAECMVYVNTLRARLALRIAGFLQREENGTGLGRADVLSWLEHLTQNDPVAGDGSPELFDGATEPLDTGAPMITWVAPADGATVTGALAVDVTAEDPGGVASLTVEVVGATSTPVTDSDPAAEHFAGTVDTTGRPEGELTLRATAVDEDGNVATADRVVVVDNLDGGSVSGVVFKGPVGGATVKIYRFPDGVKGDLLGEGVTADDGGFTNIVLGNGYSGPLLIEAGGAGTYGEEAAPATTVTFDVTDQLRTVVPVYTDGDAVSGRAVTPLTSFVVTYYEFLRTQQTGTFAEVWGAARTTMQEHFGVPDLLGLQPLRPAQMTTFSSPAKYGLVLVGLSRMAWQASNQGGGDGGSFGTSMNALRVWKVLDQDLADGCWNGMAGSTPLVFGGTQSVADDSARKRLADAIVAYLGSAQNQTPFDGAADILPLLDTLSLAGPAAGDGTTCAAGELFPTPGDTYDQTPPVMTFEAPTPGADAYVRQSITVAALATDDLDLRPATVFTAPADLADLDADGDGTDRDATITIDTASRPDGPLTITATGTDDSGNVGTGTRTFTIDNTQPVIAIDGVTADGYYPGAVTLSFSQTEANPGTLTATLDGAAFASGQSVFGEGAHTLVVTAIDLAGNTATLTRAFTIDTTAPVVTINGVTQGAYYNSSRTITYALTDTNGGTVTATLDGASFTSGGAVSAEGVHTLRVTATDLSGNETVVTRTFTIDTTAPVIAISGVDANGFYDASVTITFTQTETNPSTLTAKLDGNPFASGQSVLASGAHTLIVTALDLAGNTASLTRTFTIDTAAPQITIVGVTQGAYYNNNRTITFSQTDANPGALTAELDGSAFASGASVGAEGVHTLVVTATDLAGNQASASRTFTIDKTAPVITVNGVTPNGFYGASVTITFSQADTNPDTLTATLDAAAFTSGQSVFSEGAHTLVVTATDRAGNTSTVNRTFTVDTTAPVVTINGVTQGAYYNVGKTITFTQADANPDALSATLDGLPFVSGSTVSVEGPHTVTVTAVDRAGNQTVASRSFTIDTISPVLSIGGIAANGYYNQSVTITYAQNDANPGTLSAKLDGGAFASGQSVFGEGAHTLVVTATDLAGNTSTLSRSFTIDTVAPQVTISGVTQGAYYNTGKTITFAQNDANPGSLTGTLDGVAFASGTAVAAEGAHTLVVTATDLAGNQTVASRTFTIDTTAPAVTINGVAANAWYASAVTITFTQTEAHPGTLVATLDGVAFLSGQSVSTQGAHTLVVTATDLAGNETAVTRSFTIDTTPPVVAFEAPTPANASLVRGTISLRATASDNLDATPMVTFTAPTGLVDSNASDAIAETIYVTAADGNVTFTARAVDNAGNQATASRTFTVDNTPPTLTWSSAAFVVDNGPSEIWWTPDSGPVLTGNTADASGVTVSVTIGANSYPATVTTGAWNIDLAAGAVAANATVVTVRATDGAGNQTTIAKSLRADTLAPVVTPQTTTVQDERNDTITWGNSSDQSTYGTPVHTHTTTDQTTLGGAGCPDVYKFAYLLDETVPTFGSDPNRNPLRWKVRIADDGVGLASAGPASYRVLNQGGTILRDWTSAGTADNLGGGAYEYTFDLFRNGTNGIAALGTTEGPLQLELRALDRFGRASIVARCWTHHPLAPPVKVENAAVATDQPYALQALTLQDPNGSTTWDDIATKVLNANVAGTSLMDVVVRNGTAEDSYFTITLTAPTSAVYEKQYVVHNANTARQAVNIDCSGGSALCDVAQHSAPINSGTLNGAAAPTGYGIRVFELDASGGLAAEQPPCVEAGCVNTPTVATFRIPGRTTNVRRFRVMAVVKQITGVAPAGLGSDTASVPFADFILSYLDGSDQSHSVRLTGKTDLTYSGCSNYDPNADKCFERRTYKRYRALKSVKVTFDNGNNPTVGLLLQPAAAAQLPAVSPTTSTGNPLPGLGGLKDLGPLPAIWTSTESATLP